MAKKVQTVHNNNEKNVLNSRYINSFRSIMRENL